jgi:predicted naringenin-chalcone synthase
MEMTAYLHQIATTNPGQAYTQPDICVWMQELADNERQQRLLKMLYRASGIATRYSCITGFGKDFFSRDAEGNLVEPGTAARNTIYTREAKELALRAGRQLFEQTPGLQPGEITHVITVSCTGFFNPGIDYFLIRDLGLAPSTERYHLGFMGCYAAFPALRMAAQFCAADPQACVLVLCLELCSLHIQLGEREDQMLANALFADGAAAALVSAKPPARGRQALRFDRFTSALVPEGETDMAWSIGDRGFDIALSGYVPKILGANIAGLVDPLLADNGRSRADIDIWAIHPGGKAILDQVERSLALREEQVAASRRVLRDFGNMSSATILFVMDDLLRESVAAERRICSMAFGPGLTVETALLTQIQGLV